MKLSYDDLLIVPEYSEIPSRSEIDTASVFVKGQQMGVPLMAAPMDTVCEYDMARALGAKGAVGIIHRFMSIDEQASQVLKLKTDSISMYYQVGAAVGATGDYLERATELLNAGVDAILIDIAHGHTVHMKKAIEAIKTRHPSAKIIAGNVATAQGAKDLEAWGADAIRAGIGGGCFTPETEIKCETGLKPIKEIKVGDKVYTHTGELKEVIHTYTYDRDEEILSINGINCTKNHEFYVVHKDYKNVVNEENIHDYAEWVVAENLTKDYLLLDILP